MTTLGFQTDAHEQACSGRFGINWINRAIHLEINCAVGAVYGSTGLGLRKPNRASAAPSANPSAVNYSTASWPSTTTATPRKRPKASKIRKSPKPTPKKKREPSNQEKLF